MLSHYATPCCLVKSWNYHLFIKEGLLGEKHAAGSKNRTLSVWAMNMLLVISRRKLG